MSHDNQIKVIDSVREQLLKAESILNTQYSFDLAEPNYILVLQLIKDAQDRRSEIVELLKTMFFAGEVSDEPIAFLMHVLRWPEILTWAQDQLLNMENPIANGRPFQKIIIAFNDEWENKEFYKLFSEPNIN